MIIKFIIIMFLCISLASISLYHAVVNTPKHIDIIGAGSTFDYPFFSKAFYGYKNAQVNYQSIGSGGGIRQVIAHTVDFGATDVPMNKDELALAKYPIIQFPVTLSGVGIAYNIPGIKSGLYLSRKIIVDIYLGKIISWDDPAIIALNPVVKLPHMNIIVVHRSDGSGTTYIFTDFLSHVSKEWKQKVGAGKSVSWPGISSIGGKGNEAVASLISQTAGAIGYVELFCLLQTGMPHAIIKNIAGNFVSLNSDTIEDAAKTKPDISATNFSIVDTNCSQCYPISGYSWVVMYKTSKSNAALVNVMRWLVTTGQSLAKTIGYVPLPESVQKKTLQLLTSRDSAL